MSNHLVALPDIPGKLRKGGDSGSIEPYFSNRVGLMGVVELNKDNFEQTIKDEDFVIVDFWAPWCGPCRSFAPVYDKVSEDHEDILFAKVNTEEEQEIAAHFQIRSIPTLMIFREQVIVFAQPGALPDGAFRQLLGRAKGLDMTEVYKQVEAQRHATA